MARRAAGSVADHQLLSSVSSRRGGAGRGNDARGGPVDTSRVSRAAGLGARYAGAAVRRPYAAREPPRRNPQLRFNEGPIGERRAARRKTCSRLTSRPGARPLGAWRRFVSGDAVVLKRREVCRQY